jgi:acyl CoA:acetate/3-ketoacid CoA transferase beta subunit
MKPKRFMTLDDACVGTIVTDLAVTPQGLQLREVARGWTAEEVQSRTGASLVVHHSVPEISFAR